VSRITPVTPEEARAILKSATGRLCLSLWCGGSRTLAEIELTDDQVLVFVQKNGDRSQTLPIDSLKVRVTKYGDPYPDLGRIYFTEGDNLFLGDIPASLAENIAGALAIIQNAPSKKKEEANFDVQAKSYRDATVKPVPGEDVRRYRVQAEAAVREKRFQDAATLYGRALYLAPWWPEGHFNAALILSELGQYDRAINHMKKYLALVPGAPDARAAQDKIYAWEGEKLK
jgi:tetratricopeptide (TPR) repeat protein